MITNENIKTFTRDVLGCDCPEQVFSRIVCEDNVRIDGGLIVSHKINIGGRLLIYMWVPDQRDEFTKLFSEFISNVYFNKIQGDYRDVKVQYLEQVMRSDTSARVKTVVIRESGEIPIDYSMKQLKGKWWVYNVFVEGPSLLGNYRDEHKRILMKGSYADLIGQLKKKLEQQKGKK